MAKIESITATIPVTGQSYTDLRPTISAETTEEYRELLAEVGRLAGNDAFVQRMEANYKGWEKICTSSGCLYFNRETHEYQDEDRQPYLSGSTFAHQFVRPFDSEGVAKKTAEKRGVAAEDILSMWDMKKECSLDYGTTVHKAVEMAIKFGEMPNNAHLAALAQDALDILAGREAVSEQFVLSTNLKACGIIDALVKGSKPKHVTIVDFKTGDVFKKQSLTPEARELWDLKNEMLSVYQLQLSFYACILEDCGYTIDGLEVWAEGAEAWDVFKLKQLDVKEQICKH